VGRRPDNPGRKPGPRAARGIDYRELEDFPADRVIPDDHPVYVYYKWFWKQGDGWNAINTAVHQGLAEMGRGDLWTMHPPALRVPSVYGSGGGVTHLGQWSYLQPGPLNLAMPGDELLAMAAGASPQQQVTHTTQVFTKRSYVVRGRAKDKSAMSEDSIVDKDADAAYFPLTADQLRAAFWHKIARPVHGVSWFGIDYLLGCRNEM